MNKKPVVTILHKETYISMIRNSVSTEMFRNLYARVNGKKMDIMRNGDISCAYYVSSILFMNHFAKGIHTTVNSTLKDMQKSGWYEIKKPKVGCVLVWKNKHFIHGSGEEHKHIGFYVGKDKAVSNSDTKRSITEHSYRIHNGRGLETILWHSGLG